MTLDLQEERQQAHALLDRLPPAQLGVVRSLLAVMIEDEDDDEELTAEDIGTLRASGGPTIPFAEMVEELGFTMDQVRAGSLQPK